MEVTEQKELTTLMRDLWADWFPNKNTSADDIPRVVANKDWLRDSLVFYGWGGDKIDIVVKFVDSAAVLYKGQDPCALLSVKWSGETPSLQITYVDNRAQ